MSKDDVPSAFGLFMLIALITFAFWSVLSKEQEAWETFKNEHDCKIAAHISGSVFNTFSTDAKGNAIIGIGSTSDKTGWLCNDGVIYYR